MKKINESDQWLLNGICSKCRRSDYCKKPCMANKRMAERRMKSLVAETMNNMTGGMMKDAINKTVYNCL